MRDQGERSNKVLGWAVADHIGTEFVLKALDLVVAERAGDVRGTIIQSDRGNQCTAEIVKQSRER